MIADAIVNRIIATEAMIYDDGITYVGIDPGGSGSIAVLRGDEVSTTKKFDSMTERDIWQALVELAEPCRVIIEIVGPNRKRSEGNRAQGASGMFTFGQSYGFLRGIIVASGFPFCEVRPQKWQPAMGLASIKDESATDKKNRHKAKAQQLYPAINVIHANADSLLLATYCRRYANQLF